MPYLSSNTHLIKIVFIAYCRLCVAYIYGNHRMVNYHVLSMTAIYERIKCHLNLVEFIEIGYFCYFNKIIKDNLILSVGLVASKTGPLKEYNIDELKWSIVSYI